MKATVHDGNSNKGKASLTFHPEIPVPGLYDIRLAYSPAASRSSQDTHHCKAMPEERRRFCWINANHPTEYGRFRSIGQFELNAGGDHILLRITNEGTDGYVVVDAVQWYLLDETDPESAESSRRTSRLC